MVHYSEVVVRSGLSVCFMSNNDWRSINFHLKTIDSLTIFVVVFYSSFFFQCYCSSLSHPWCKTNFKIHFIQELSGKCICFNSNGLQRSALIHKKLINSIININPKCKNLKENNFLIQRNWFNRTLQNLKYKIWKKIL